jgi:hypothetical protein
MTASPYPGNRNTSRGSGAIDVRASGQRYGAGFPGGHEIREAFDVSLPKGVGVRKAQEFRRSQMELWGTAG